MKNNITIKNFRVFDKKGVTVNINPLTFLVGCNSSGKSSIVKAMSLLKTFFMNKYDKEHAVLGAAIDFTVKPNNTLGSFRNVVRSSSRDKTVSLSYETHSSYLNDDVVVTITLGNGELGNPKVSAIKISKMDGPVLVSGSVDKAYFTGNLASIKDSFKQYLVATRLRENIHDMLPPDPDIPLSESDKQRILELEKEASQHCPEDYLNEVFLDKNILSPRPNKKGENAIDKYVETGIMSYMSILDELAGLVDSREISALLKSKVKEGKLHDALIRAIDHVCKEYDKSKCPDFISYFRSLEDEYLFPARNLPIKVLRNVDVHFGILSMNRADYVYTIIDPDRDPRNFEPYGFAHDMLSDLTDGDDPYSSICKDIWGIEEMDKRLHPLYNDWFKEYVERFCQEVVSKDVTESLDYISSSRIQVRRMYPLEDRNEFTDAVRRYFETRTKFMTLDPPIVLRVQENYGDEKREVKVSDFVPGSFMSEWLHRFKIGHHMSLEMDKNGLGLLLKVYRSESDKQGILLADMGYGITQLFSILLQIEEMIMSALYVRYRNKVTSVMGGELTLRHFVKEPLDPRTVAIEEPEIHLHPKFQSLLAEVFLEAYKSYNIQFIVETHSEYLLRKVQTMIGLKELDPEEVSMVYVEDDKEVKQDVLKVRRIPVKKDGRLAEPFGPGFYDEADNLSLELFTNIGK